MKNLLTILLTLVCFTFFEGALHAEDIGGGTFVLRGYETLKDGTIKLDSLIVNVDPNRKETNIQVTQFDPKGNGKNKWMSTSELSKKPVGDTKFRLIDNTILTQKNLYFGVSQDNQLILVVQTSDNSIKVVKDLKGHYDVKDLQSGKPVTVVNCEKTVDGRIKLP
jgi:hypothetical protein